MSIVVQDEEVFEITDFTTATEWERFIARIEEVIHEWKLTNVLRKRSLKRGEITNGVWKKRLEEITYADTRFNMVHHCLELEDDKLREEDISHEDEEPLPQTLEDMMSMENDFPFRAHCLSRWFGLREFVILTPTVQIDAITSESKVKLLLSSICVAINNSSCSIPFFVQVHHVQESFYLGICEGGGVRTCFEMVHLHKTPNKANHLTGILDIFKAKLASPRLSAPVSVSIRFTYVLHDFAECIWPQQPPDLDLLGGEVGIDELSQFPFGSSVDPISEFYLSTTWPCLSEDVIVDNDVFSDLDPQQAPQWSLRVVLIDSPPCLLYNYLSSVLALAKKQDSTESLLGRSFDDGNDRHYSQPLDRLTDMIPLNVSVSSVVNRSNRRNSKPDNDPIARSQLQQLLDYLFPDAKPKSSESDIKDFEPQTTKSLGLPEDAFYRSLKSAPPGSLTWRLGVCLAHVNHAYKSATAVAHLWSEFILEMRYRWEISCLLPELEGGVPDLGCCLLHQKLQMLNCCIERKRARRNRLQQGIPQWEKHRSISEEERESSSDEEFFECNDRPSSGSGGAETTSDNIDRPASSISSNNSTDTVYKDSLSHQPDGRLRRAGDLRLLHSDQPLYIPITQEPTPMTEDSLEEHAEVLVQLGTDAQGAELRAKMQSACLLSDMEAFKAANPGCCLEDFVRWYSPRDWIQDEENPNKGHLSTRMLLPENVWTEAWSTAQPLPARRQRRLFDDTREAEKVLHWLSSLTMGQLVSHLLPVILHASIVTASKTSKEHSLKKCDTIAKAMDLEPIVQKAAKAMRAPKTDLSKYEEVARLLAAIEVHVARIHSLTTKLDSSGREKFDSLIQELLQQNEVTLIGGSRGPAALAILKLFTQAQKSANMVIDGDSSEEELAFSDDATHSTKHPAISEFPKPAGREFILRSNVPRPASYSMPTPQRLFCVLKADSIRMAGAFSMDTTFQ